MSEEIKKYNSEEFLEEEELIDIKALFLQLACRRRFILKFVCAFAVLGLLAALFQKPVYTSTCTFVPDKTSPSSNGGTLSSLAAMAGINLGDMTSSASLSPLVYPQLLQNASLNKELMRVPLHFRKYPEPVSLYDLATDPRYRKFSLIGTIKKYTIGLPFLIVDAIKGEKEESSDSTSRFSVESYTKKEYAVARSLSKMVRLDVEKKEGYLRLSTKAGEALVSAELCQAALTLMQKYVAEFKLNQARERQGFIQDRYDEAKDDYIEKQTALAQFVDSNRGSLTASTQALRQQLVAEYEIATALFTEVSKQRLQAEMKVKEDTPVLSVVKQVNVPMKKSNSRTMTLFIWIFAGLLLSCVSVFSLDALKNRGVRLPFIW